MPTTRRAFRRLSRSVDGGAPNRRWTHWWRVRAPSQNSVHCNRHPPLSSAVTAMVKPVQWMTLQELRDELDRARPAWDTTDLDGSLADGQLPALTRTCTVTSWSRAFATTSRPLSRTPTDTGCLRCAQNERHRAPGGKCPEEAACCRPVLRRRTEHSEHVLRRHTGETRGSREACWMPTNIMQILQTDLEGSRAVPAGPEHGCGERE